MSKVIGLKLTNNDKKLIKQIEDSGLSNSEIIRKALDHYLKSVNSVNQPVNHFQQEKVKQKVNLVNQKVNHEIQVIENYELLRHYKEEVDWLRNRVEYFEGFCKDLRHDMSSKIDTKKTKKETAISFYRM